MRIIGGKYKGRWISTVPGLKARPTTDLARESLFNILTNRINFENICVLDLFSGTGSVSFEFASRGVKCIHSIEIDSKHVQGIKKGIDRLREKNIKVVRIDVKTYLKTCKSKYDIIFADPPYDLEWILKLPDLILKSDILTEDGFIILEHPKNISYNDHPHFFEHRRYGSVNFSFFKPPKIASISEST